MAEGKGNPGPLARRAEGAFQKALSRAYQSVRVRPDQYLLHLRAAHGLPVATFDGMFTLPVAELDSIAWQTVRGSMKMAGAEGAGFGLGGFFTLVPDIGILATITLRMLQKLSLIYGFEFNTEEEVAELWIATATAAGVDLGRDVLEKTLLRGFVEKVIGRIARRFGTEFAEKSVARAVPVLSSLVGAVLNYYFVRTWGRRAIAHFQQRHLEERSRRAALYAQNAAPELPSARS
jgi:uncharacterized protein (DUF697 family)